MRAVAIGIVGAVLGLVLKRSNPEIGILLSLSVSLLVLGLGMQVMGAVLEFVDTLQSATNLSPALFGPVLQTVGIGILTRIASDICKDAGQGAIASSLELAGTVVALYIALPLMQTVLQMIGRLL